MPTARSYISSLKQLLTTDCAAHGADERTIELAWLLLFDVLKTQDLNDLTPKQLDQALEEVAIPTATGTNHPETAARLQLNHFVHAHDLSQREILLQGYLLALHARGCSKATIKNYLSDIRQLFAISSEKHVEETLTETQLRAFIKKQEYSGLAQRSIRRKLTTTAQFAKWLLAEGVIEASRADSLYQLSQTYARPYSRNDQAMPLVLPNVAVAATTSQPDSIKESTTLPQTTQSETDKKPIVIEKNADSQLLSTNLQDKVSPNPVKPSQSKKTYNINRFLQKMTMQGAVTALALMLSVLGLTLLAWMQFLQKVNQPLAYPTALTRPSRSLSFQGRLTNPGQNPIVTATDMNFKLYDSGPSTTGGTVLWDSGTCSVDPDQDGIFSTGLGSDCGAEIANSVFSENANVWLQITVGTAPAEVLSPRQSIKSVAYALNAETVQGYPASASAVENTVIVMNNSGEIVLGNSAPKIQATSTNGLTIEGQSLYLTTTSGSNGNVNFSPDGTGKIMLNGNASSSGTLSFTGTTDPKVNVLNGENFGISTSVGGDTALTERVTVLNGGNVGIGDTTPTYRLDVNGTGRFTGAVDLDADLELNSTLTDGNNNVGTNGQILSSTSTGVDWIDATTFTDNYTDSVAFNTSDGVFTLGRTGSLPDLTVDLDGRYTLSGTDDWIDEIGDTITGTLNFSAVTNDITTGTNEHLALMPNGTGNVGIGSTGPGTKLDVTGSIRSSGQLISTVATGTAPLAVSSNDLVTNLNADYLDNYHVTTLPFVNDTGNTTLTRSGVGPYTLVLNLGNANTWTAAQTFTTNTNFDGTGADGIWTSTGNVGIGTITPGSYLLNVNGTTNIAGLLTSTAITNTGALTSTGGVVSLNASSNNAVNIGTGTTTSAVTIGGNANDVIIDSDTWNVSSLGAATGLTGITSSGTINFSGLTASKVVFTDASSNLTSTGTVPVDQGGTGATTLTGMLKGNGTSAVTAVTGTAGYNSYWSDANTIGTEQFTNVTRGGMGANMTAAGAGEIPYSTSTTAYGHLAAGTSGMALISGGATAPTWGTLGLTYGGTNANLSTVATGGLMYKGATALAGTAALTGVVKGNGASAPSAMTSNANYVTYWSDANTLTGEAQLALTRGGSNKSLTAVAGGVVWTDADSMELTAAGTAGQILKSNGTTAPTWVDSSTLPAGDATTLDTIDSTQFLRSDTSDSYTSGTLTTDATTTLDVNGNLAVADTDIVLDGATTNFTATGNLSINTDDFVVQKTDGNVGIGTTAPAAFKLQVAGHVGPQTDDTYNLGSSSLRWRDLYLGPTSLHLTSTIAETATARDWKLGLDETNGATDGNFRIMEGASQYVTIKTDGNVGIGSTSPAQKVDVVGNVAFTGALMPNGNAGTLDYFLRSAGAGAPPVWADLSSLTLPSGTTGQTLRHNGTSWVANSVIYNDGTNVGIGTTVPGLFRLNVSGDANMSGALTLGTQATTTAHAVRADRSISSGTGLTGGGNLTADRTVSLTGQALALHNLATNGLIARTAAGTVAARTITGTSNQISVTDGDGVAGNPTLSLPQNIHTSATPTFARLTLTEPTLSPLVVTSTVVVTNLNADLLDGYSIGNMPFVDNTTNTTLTRSGSGPYTLGLNLGNANSWTGAQTFTANTYFPVNGVWDTTGNVGIGVASPGSKLDVGGNIRISNGSGINSTGDSVLFHTDKTNDTTVEWLGFYSGAQRQGMLAYDGTIAGCMTGTSVLCLYADNSNYLNLHSDTGVILTGGNVGVGSTAPAAKLDIADSLAGDLTMRLKNTNVGSTTSRSVLTVEIDSVLTQLISYGDAFTSSGAQKAAGSLLYTNGTGGLQIAAENSTSGAIRFYTDGVADANERMVIANDGNVGIGLTTPASMLDIDTGSNTLGLRIRGLAETTEFADLFVGASGELVITTVPGSDSTSAFLDLRPESTAYGIVLRESDGTGTASYANFFVNDAADDYLSINVNSVTDGDALVVTASNNVGIGSLAPGAKLDVQGQIIGGFGAVTSAGTLDWNDSTNARPGSGYTILLGTATNGPGGGAYYHPFSFEYSTKDGTGNMTQFAVPYNSTALDNGYYMRTRFSGTWTGWSRIISENTAGLVNITSGLTVVGTVTLPSASLSKTALANSGTLGFDWADSEVSDTLTSSLFVGSGSTTTAIDLATAEAAGVLTVAKGGTGVTTLTGMLIGNATSAYTATTVSSGIAGELSDETGTGALVFGTSPTFTTSLNTPIVNRTSGNLTLQTTTSGHIVLSAAGNVGIGSTSPGAELDIAGTARVQDRLWVNDLDATTASGNGGIQFAGSFAGSGAGYVQGRDDGTNSLLQLATNRYITKAGAWAYGISARSSMTMQIDDSEFRIGSFPASSLTWTERFSVGNSGNVGIGTSGPSQLLDVNGNARVRSIGSGAYSGPINRMADGTFTTATSDIRLKKDISTIDHAIDKVMRLRGVTFNWQDSLSPNRMTGMIAQEVLAVMPELVTQNPTDGYLGLLYGETSGLLVEAIKEQQGQISALAANSTTSLTFTSEGDLLIGDSTSNYTITPVGGSALSTIIGSAQAVIGKIRAGLVTTSDLVVTNSASVANLTVNSLQVGGQSLTAYIENVVSNMQLNNSTSLPSGSFISELNTEDLTASGSATLGDTIADTLSVNKNASISGNLAVASDASIAGNLQANSSRLGSLLSDTAVLGTATISGVTADDEPILDVRGSARMQALEAQVANLQDVRSLTATLYDATISGTLYANTIDGLDAKVAAGLQPTLLQQLIGYDPAATDSAQLIARITGVDLGTTLVLDPSALDSLPTNPTLLGANAGFFEHYLQVNGNTALGGNLMLAGNLNMTGGMTIANNSISYIPLLPGSSTTLYIQPSGTGSLDLMNGLALLENGAVTVTGDVTFTKNITVAQTLFTDLLAPTSYDGPVQVKVAGIATESGELKQSRFEIINELDAPVATISAQGKADFAGGISVGRDGIVSQDASGSATVNKSSGKAVISAGSTQIRLLSAQIKPDTLIYVTAQGDTANQSLYIKNQIIGEAVIGFNTPLPADLRFNWWIVE